MKIYYAPYPTTNPDFEVPKLYTVAIGPDWTITSASMVRNWDFEERHKWCTKNCKDKFYSHWNGNWQFEDDEDAMLFALRWK